MFRLKKTTLVLSGLLCILAAAIIVGLSNLSGHNKIPASPATDLSKHPVYSKYRFGASDKNVIDFGVQPLGIPIGIIAEAIARDNVLAQALKQANLELRFHPFLKGADINYFLNRGDINIALAGDMPALTAAAASSVMIVSLAKLGFSSIVAKKHMLIKDLRGKRIGYPYGSNAHYALLRALEAAGLHEKEVHLVRLDVNKMPQALDNDEIDAFTAWEPVTTIAQTNYKDQVVIHSGLSTSYLYFSSSLIQQNPELARLIIAAQIRAMGWMRLNPDNLIKMCEWAIQTQRKFLESAPFLSAKQCASIVNSDLLNVAPIPTIPQNYIVLGGQLHQEFVFLKSLGKIPKKVRWERIWASFDTNIINNVLSERAKYKIDTVDYKESR